MPGKRYVEGCAFCAIVAGDEPAEVVASWRDALAIEPLAPVTPGHVLVLPRLHVVDAIEDPNIAGGVMARAAELAERPCNLITSAGAEATQTVWHLHVHIVPRSTDDGLALPWAPAP